MVLVALVAVTTAQGIYFLIFSLSLELKLIVYNTGAVRRSTLLVDKRADGAKEFLSDELIWINFLVVIRGELVI